MACSGMGGWNQINAKEKLERVGGWGQEEDASFAECDVSREKKREC